ncbi:MAG TPA: hypothetical protein PLG57_00390 [Bacteroidia bacterium]|jgi:hypothetical protein|nr:hypothetical protein [Bacteroidia bacterium]HQK97977.1 hypothetical protein [Bacteroidia bacterium]
MKKLLVLFTFLTIAFNSAKAQDSLAYVDGFDNPKLGALLTHFFVGGDISGSGGDVDYFYFAPTLGYKIANDMGVGIGPVYTYLHDARLPKKEYTTNGYGGRIFAQQRLFSYTLLYAEYEVINVDVWNVFQTNLSRHTIGNGMAGVGYTQPLFNRFNFTVMGLYVFAPSKYSYYNDIIIRAGINLGF